MASLKQLQDVVFSGTGAVDSVLKRLAGFLDNPAIPWKRVIFSFTIAQWAFESYLTKRQFDVYQRTKVPKTLDSVVDQETYDKSQAYGRAKAKFSLFNNAFGTAHRLLEIHFNFNHIVWSAVGVAMAKYAPARFSGEITQSLLFFFAYNLFSTAISIPISYYHHFIMEEKFGFNKMTVKTWLTDMVKSQLLTIAFGAPIGAGILSIIKATGDQFFYYVWSFMVVVQLIAVTIYPIFIVPLFNKLTPLPDGSLRVAVNELAGRLNFPLKELDVIDGSKRSSHSNAYFTGLPWKKKIVLFDTLIEQQSQEQVVAVLAHELGHWQYGHTSKLLLINSSHLFFIFALFSSFIHNKQMFSEFGFTNEMPIMIGFFLFSSVLTPSECVMQFVMHGITRAFEYQADAFAVQLGYKEKLAEALIKLQMKNLSAMDADPLYSAFTYTHPILPERLRAIGWVGAAKS